MYVYTCSIKYNNINEHPCVQTQLGRKKIKKIAGYKIRQ